MPGCEISYLNRQHGVTLTPLTCTSKRNRFSGTVIVTECSVIKTCCLNSLKGDELVRIIPRFSFKKNFN